MGNKASKTKLVTDRLIVVMDRIQLLEAEIKGLQLERERLEITLDVLDSLSDSQEVQAEDKDIGEHVVSTVDDKKKRTRTTRTRKSRGRRISDVILEYFQGQEVGCCLGPKAVHAALAHTGEVGSMASVNTTMARMVDKGDLIRVSDGYRLRKKEEPNAVTSGSSDVPTNPADEAGTDAGGTDQQALGGSNEVGDLAG